MHGSRRHSQQRDTHCTLSSSWSRRGWLCAKCFVSRLQLPFETKLMFIEVLPLNVVSQVSFGSPIRVYSREWSIRAAPSSCFFVLTHGSSGMYSIAGAFSGLMAVGSDLTIFGLFLTLIIAWRLPYPFDQLQKLAASSMQAPIPCKMKFTNPFLTVYDRSVLDLLLVFRSLLYRSRALCMIQLKRLSPYDSAVAKTLFSVLGPHSRRHSNCRFSSRVRHHCFPLATLPVLRCRTLRTRFLPFRGFCLRSA